MGGVSDEFGFEIEGRLYGIVLPGQFTQDECGLFYEIAGWSVEEIWIDEIPFSEWLKRDGAMTALTTIAYRRGNPDAAAEDVRLVIGSQNRMELLASLFRSLFPEDENPKAEGTTSVPNESSTSSSDENPSTPPPEDESSGSSSETSSGQPDEAPAGIGESGGPSTSVPLRQVV